MPLPDRTRVWRGGDRRVLPFVLVALLALVLPSVAAVPATAQLAPDRSILVLSKDPYTDTDEEDTEITAALRTEFGVANVTVTDGGDATAATWTGLLSGVDTLVIPESDSGEIWTSGRTESARVSGAQTWPITDEAMTVITAWTEAGGIVMGTGSYSHRAIIQRMTGRTYPRWSDDWPANGILMPGQTYQWGSWDAAVYSGDVITGAAAGWEQWASGYFARLEGDASLPDRLPGADWTGGLIISDSDDVASDWSVGDREGLSIVYGNSGPYTGDETRSIEQIGVGVFSVGSGAYLYYAYDWYPDPADRSTIVSDPTHTAQWNLALVLGAGGAITEAAGIGSSSSGGTTAPPSDGSRPVPVVGGGNPVLDPGVGVLQAASGATVPMTVSSPSSGSVRYSTDGFIVTLTGATGTGMSRGLVATPEGTVDCEVCAFLASGGVIEAWMFSEPRLVAAWRVEELETFLAGLPCQRFTIPVGAPLDGGGVIPVGTHTLQLQLPTASGVQAVNVGVTVGSMVPTAVRAGEGSARTPVRSFPTPVVVALALVAAVAVRRRGAAAAIS